MLMNYLIAAAAILGGIDKILGNRFGLGKRFDEGFRLLGPLISGMAGILCLSPLLTKALQFTIAPFFYRIGLDPAVLGGVLPIDMGGFQLAENLAEDPQIGKLSGVFITSTFGCTLIFSIPVGFGMMKVEHRPDFLLGILYGLMALPLPLLLGGLCCGLNLIRVLEQILPVLLLTFILAFGIRTFPKAMIRIFTFLTKLIEAVSIFGILAGFTAHLTGLMILPEIMPIREAIETAALCGLIMIGSLPLAEILNRLLHKPLQMLGKRFGMQENGITSLLLSLVSLPASFALMHEESSHDITLNAAFLVSAASVFGAHLAVCTEGAPELVPTFIITKLFSGIITIILAGMLLRKQEREQHEEARTL